MDEYKVTIENGEVKTTEKGSCGEALTPVAYKCKRATELHKEECERDHSTYYCSGAGYAGKTIEYGNLGTKGAEPVGGDAFDCAVKDTNGNSIIDDNDMTERFYYVSDLYDPTIEGDDKFNHEVAVLIYYSNTANESASETSPIAYDSTHGNNVDENWHGPLTAKTYLPRTIGWTNMSLTNTNRQILNEKGEAKSNNGVNSLPTFSYEEYATRLLTTQELESGCGIDNGIGKNGELENCNYLLENTIYTSNQSDTGYWLENPSASTSYGVWFVNGSSRAVSYNSVSFSANGAYGVRPAIEVLKTDIDF